MVLPLPTENWDPSLAHVSAEMGGAPINVQKLMANSPGLLAAWWDFRNYSVAGGSLGPRVGELVILRVAVHLGSWYEWGSHVDRAVRLGVPVDTVLSVMDRQIASSWTEKEALILRAVDELLDHREICEETRNALDAHFTTAQVMDLIAIQGMYVTLGCMINTWGLDLDSHVAARIADFVDQDSFEAAARRFQTEANGDSSA